MPTWNADQYLKFGEQRIRPCHDLLDRVARASLQDAKRIIDLGCGPGNSTAELAERWPDAEISGLDNSAAMIEVARREQPHRRWIFDDISSWTANEKERFDIVFSNAALQWVPDHASLFPRLMERVAPGGALAIQIPADFNALPHRLMRELAPSGARAKEWFSHEPAFYYDVLAGGAAGVDIWEAIYQHLLATADDIVEWYKGSGLRPFLEAIPNETDRNRFMAEYKNKIGAAYPAQPDGKVLFPFRRLFIVAHR
jgi:trans-aconitate 2-methyltransferase